MPRFATTLAMTLGWGVLAAAALPYAGFTNLVFDLTPWSFFIFAMAVGHLYKTLTATLETKKRSPFQIFLISYIWMFGYFLMGLNWVGNALLVDGNPYIWAYPFALIGLPLLLSFFSAISFLIAAPLLRQAPDAIRPLVFCSIFSLAEYARGHLLTGFPWNLPAMIWSETPSIFQSLSAIGPYGLTLFTLIWSLALSHLTTIWGARNNRQQQNRATLFLAVISFGIVLGYGLLSPPALLSKTKETLQAVLIQASIPQADKWDDRKLMDHFYTHIGLSDRPDHLAEQPTLILWPETAIAPSYIYAPVIRSAIAGLLQTYPKGSALLTGALRQENGVYYNSAVLYDQTGTPHIIYDKFHLVPFGEYMPFQELIPLGPISQFEGLGHGTGPRTITPPSPITLPPFSPLICYEIIFPGHITPATTTNSQRPLWIANMTNDSWYGNSPGPYQHLAQAKARAIEEGIPVLRAAGNGISAILTPDGHVAGKLDYNEKSALVVRIPLPNTSPTLYHLQRDTPFLTAIIIILLLGMVGFRKLL